MELNKWKEFIKKINKGNTLVEEGENDEEYFYVFQSSYAPPSTFKYQKKLVQDLESIASEYGWEINYFNFILYSLNHINFSILFFNESSHADLLLSVIEGNFYKFDDSYILKYPKKIMSDLNKICNKYGLQVHGVNFWNDTSGKLNFILKVISNQKPYQVLSIRFAEKRNELYLYLKIDAIKHKDTFTTTYALTSYLENWIRNTPKWRLRILTGQIKFIKNHELIKLEKDFA